MEDTFDDVYGVTVQSRVGQLVDVCQQREDVLFPQVSHEQRRVTLQDGGEKFESEEGHGVCVLEEGEQTGEQLLLQQVR